MIKKNEEKISIHVKPFGLIAFFLFFLCGTGKAACIPPTTAASALAVSHVGCNSVKLSWTSGNGNKRIVVVYSGAITLPASGTTYAHSFTWGSGATLGTGHVVYDSTGNSVVILGLTASTTYTFEVYEYNTAGTCYLTPGTSITKATTTCNDCPQITGIMIDACNDACASSPGNTTTSTPCCEGNSEFLIISTGAYGWDNNVATPPNIKYGSTTAGTTHTVSTYATEASPITTLNSACGCAAGSFIDASAGSVAIPARSNVMIGVSNYPSDDFCPNHYTFTSMCAASSPIYCLFGTDNNLVYSGNYDNYSSTNPDIRYFIADFSGINASCAVQYYQYDAHLESNGNGASINFGDPISTSSASPLAATYNPLSCGDQPTTLLPVTLISFTANYNAPANNIKLNWVTASEINNKMFTVQKSIDGNAWVNAITVAGSGTSFENRYYNSTDDSPFEGSSFYRLMQTDYDGHNTVSNTIVSVNVNSQNNLFKTDPNPADKSVLVSFHCNEASNSVLTIYDLTGRLIDTRDISSSKGLNNIEINTESYKNGMYFIVIHGQEQQYFGKLIISHH
jgi:hypothetical protein